MQLLHDHDRRRREGAEQGGSGRGARSGRAAGSAGLLSTIPTEAYWPGGPSCPLVTAHLPGLGGRLLPNPEDFQVDEIPAYLPSGEGPHYYVRVQKRDLTTEQARWALAQAAGCDPRDLGAAGRKDRHAVTTQWFSLPVPPVAPADERLTLLEQGRHANKLRMGHLRGNRFRVRLSGVDPAAALRLPELVTALEAGVPNYFGEQRFGREGGNIEAAVGLVLRPQRRVRDPGFLASALQAAVFNRWLGERVRDGLLHVALEGDVLRKRESGGLFACVDPAVDTARMMAGEIDPTGPLPGRKMKAATGAVAERDAAAQQAMGLPPEAWTVLERFAPGTRRAARVVPAELRLDLDGTTLTASFTLPAGSFATVVLAELVHPVGQLRAEAAIDDSD